MVPYIEVILNALLRLKSEEIELSEALLLGVVASLNVRGVQASIKHSLQTGNLVAEVETANIKRRLGNLERQRSGLNVQGGSLSALLTGVVSHRCVSEWLLLR